MYVCIGVIQGKKIKGPFQGPSFAPPLLHKALAKDSCEEVSVNLKLPPAETLNQGPKP